MPISILSIFSDLYNKIMKSILNPIRDWLTSILKEVFSFVFDKVLKPVLIPILEAVMETVGYSIMDFFYTGMYSCFRLLLLIIDIMQMAFDVLIGIQPVTYMASDGTKRTDTLLNVLILDDGIRNVVIAVTLIAVGLAMMFAIYSVIRSTLDFDFENKRPVGQVLRSVLKTMINFLIVPFTMIVMLYLASIILTTASTALSASNQDLSLSRSILAISSLDGNGIIKEKFRSEYINTVCPTEGDLSVQPWADLASGKISFADWPDYYHISQIDYLIGLISSVFIIIVIGMCLFTFIQRIFDVIMLFVVSPYFVSTMVLDDGEKFSRWRSVFIAKVFSGYGSAIGMRLYLMIIPLIMSNKIMFFTDSIVGSLGNYIVKLLFIMGGAWAVYKSSTMLTTILDQGVGYNEQMSNMAGMAMMHSAFRSTTHAANKAGKYLGSKLGKSKSAPALKSNKFSGNMAPVDKFNAASVKIDGAKGAVGDQKAMISSEMGKINPDMDYTATIDAQNKQVGFVGGGATPVGGIHNGPTFSANAKENLDMFDLSKGMSSLSVGGQEMKAPEGFTVVPSFVPKGQEKAAYDKLRKSNPNLSPVYDKLEKSGGKGLYYKSHDGKAQVDLMNTSGMMFDVPAGMSMVPQVMSVDKAKEYCAEKAKGSDFMSNYYKRMGTQLSGKNALAKENGQMFSELARGGVRGVYLTPTADGKSLKSVDTVQRGAPTSGSTGGYASKTDNAYSKNTADDVVKSQGFKGTDSYFGNEQLAIEYPSADDSDTFTQNDSVIVENNQENQSATVQTSLENSSVQQIHSQYAETGQTSNGYTNSDVSSSSYAAHRTEETHTGSYSTYTAEKKQQSAGFRPSEGGFTSETVHKSEPAKTYTNSKSQSNSTRKKDKPSGFKDQ